MSFQNNIVEVLQLEHHYIKDLMLQYNKAPHAMDKYKLALKICHEISVHMLGKEISMNFLMVIVEDQIFYPVVKHVVPTGVQAAEYSDREHSAIKELCKELENASPENTKFFDMMDELQKEFNRHSFAEENMIIPAFVQEITPIKLKELGEAFVKSKKAADRIAIRRSTYLYRKVKENLHIFQGDYYFTFLYNVM